MPEKEAVRIEDGKLFVDMAAADELWRSLDPMKQAEMTNLMFEPVLANATKMRLALLDIIEECAGREGCGNIADMARAALPGAR